MVFYHDDSTPWPWPAISYIDVFLMSALSSMLELVVSVECSCSCSIVMEFLNIWCVYCFIWWNKEESQKTVYFILILFRSLSNHLLRARYIHIRSAIRIRNLGTCKQFISYKTCSGLCLVINLFRARYIHIRSGISIRNLGTCNVFIVYS